MRKQANRQVGEKRTSRTGQILLSLLLAPVLMTLLLSGCGSGSGSGGGTSSSSPERDTGVLVTPLPPATGKATFTVLWPQEERGGSAAAASRLVPTLSRSIQVVVREATAAGGEHVTTQVLNRPTDSSASTATLDPLPTGDLVVTATAFPESGAAGVPLATATAPLLVRANETTKITVTLASTIERLELSPAEPSVLAGQTATLIATARNAAGEIVLTAPDTITWSSSATETATIDGRGILSGVLPGRATITAIETESGKSAQVGVAVTSNALVSISPSSSVTLSPGQKRSFTASVSETSDQRVVWSIQEGSAGGAISEAGLYTAPGAIGDYHIVATSQYDPAKSATVTVQVRTDNLPIIVD